MNEALIPRHITSANLRSALAVHFWYASFTVLAFSRTALVKLKLRQGAH